MNTKARTANAAASTSAQNSAPADKPKAYQAFYARPTGEGKGALISLFVNTVATKGAPDFDGKINGKHVALRIRHGVNGTFLAVTCSATPERVAETGYREEQIGTANVLVNDRGYPVLGIKLLNDEGRTIWANVARTLPQSFLVEAGLSLKVLAEKKAAAAAARAAKAAQHESEQVPA